MGKDFIDWFLFGLHLISNSQFSLIIVIPFSFALLKALSNGNGSVIRTQKITYHKALLSSFSSSSSSEAVDSHVHNQNKKRKLMDDSSMLTSKILKTHSRNVYEDHCETKDSFYNKDHVGENRTTCEKQRNPVGCRIKNRLWRRVWVVKGFSLQDWA